jgi:hypothetical protein
VCCGYGSLYSTRSRNKQRRREKETRPGVKGSELAGQRTEQLAALEAQPQTVPVGKSTAEEVPEKVVPTEDRYKGNQPFLL